MDAKAVASVAAVRAIACAVGTAHSLVPTGAATAVARGPDTEPGEIADHAERDDEMQDHEQEQQPGVRSDGRLGDRQPQPEIDEQRRQPAYDAVSLSTSATNRDRGCSARDDEHRQQHVLDHWHRASMQYRRRLRENVRLATLGRPRVCSERAALR